MAINQKGAVIPYQPTYSIQYKYGDRYGPQSFASPTTALGATGQAGGPLSSQATLDQTTEETANPVVSAEGGDGETLDSKAEGAPGGTGGADFSQFRNQYTPVQPDFGWQYSSTYGDDLYEDPSVSGIFNPPEVPPESGFGSGIIDDGDGGDDGYGVTELSPEVNSPTAEYVGFDLIDDIQSINESGMGVGTSGDLGGPTGAGYTAPPDATNPSGGAGYNTPGVDTNDPNSMGGIDGLGGEVGSGSQTDTSSQNTDSGQSGDGGDGAGGTSAGAGEAEDSVGDGYGGGDYKGALIPPRGIPRRFRDNNIPNPLLQDPLADLFRRA